MDSLDRRESLTHMLARYGRCTRDLGDVNQGAMSRIGGLRDWFKGR